ncbi:hypothetical protein BC938DRAFT_471118 [Jimgerdemannia flammicorona]|uniref:Uncharacterized protein n=1 Tax=Jimgerdemannia flammicorona TaxID=994334 RepID=A0A433QUX5_9FUNG|nr:hypothetical protein BC938DRAFT_471118 [Jimgerdemannia flammicorona]
MWLSHPCTGSIVAPNNFSIASSARRTTKKIMAEYTGGLGREGKRPTHAESVRPTKKARLVKEKDGVGSHSEQDKDSVEECHLTDEGWHILQEAVARITVSQRIRWNEVAEDPYFKAAGVSGKQLQQTWTARKTIYKYIALDQNHEPLLDDNKRPFIVSNEGSRYRAVWKFACIPELVARAKAADSGDPNERTMMLYFRLHSKVKPQTWNINANEERQEDPDHENLKYSAYRKVSVYRLNLELQPSTSNLELTSHSRIRASVVPPIITMANTNADMKRSYFYSLIRQDQ